MLTNLAVTFGLWAAFSLQLPSESEKTSEPSFDGTNAERLRLFAEDQMRMWSDTSQAGDL